MSGLNYDNSTNTCICNISFTASYCVFQWFYKSFYMQLLKYYIGFYCCQNGNISQCSYILYPYRGQYYVTMVISVSLYLMPLTSTQALVCPWLHKAPWNLFPETTSGSSLEVETKSCFRKWKVSQLIIGFPDIVNKALIFGWILFHKSSHAIFLPRIGAFKMSFVSMLMRINFRWNWTFLFYFFVSQKSCNKFHSYSSFTLLRKVFHISMQMSHHYTTVWQTNQAITISGKTAYIIIYMFWGVFHSNFLECNFCPLKSLDSHMFTKLKV